MPLYNPNMSFDTKKTASATVSETLPLLDDTDADIDFETTRYAPDVTAEEEMEEEEQSILLSESRILEHKKINLFIITVVSLLYFTSLASSISSTIVLTIRKICQDLCSYKLIGDDNNLSLLNAMDSFSVGKTKCDSDRAQSINSSLTSILLFSSSLVNVIVAGKVGELSDKYGRKVMLIICCLVSLIARCLTALLLTSLVKFNVYLFIGFSLLESFTGGMKSMAGILKSYVIDLVEPEERIPALSVMTGTVLFGVAAGPLINNFANKISNGNDFVAVFGSLIGTLLVGILLIICVPETHFTHNKRLEHQHQHQHQLEQTRSSFSDIISALNFFVKIFESLKLFWIRKTPSNPKPLKKRLSVLFLVAIDLITSSSMVTTIQTTVLYATLKFKWNTIQIGYLLSFVGILGSLQSFVIIPAYMKFMESRGYVTKGDGERKTLTFTDLFNLRFATTMYVIQSVLLVCARSPVWLYAAVTVGSFGTINQSTIHSCLVKLCSENVEGRPGSNDSRIGELFGAISLQENLSIMFISSTLMMVFSKTALSKANTCFILSSLLMIVAGVLTWLISSENRKDSLLEENEEADELDY